MRSHLIIFAHSKYRLQNPTIATDYQTTAAKGNYYYLAPSLFAAWGIRAGLLANPYAELLLLARFR